jgi:hypothetical protein
VEPPDNTSTANVESARLALIALELDTAFDELKAYEELNAYEDDTLYDPEFA